MRSQLNNLVFHASFQSAADLTFKLMVNGTEPLYGMLHSMPQSTDLWGH
jgi:hypothetical protein